MPEPAHIPSSLSSLELAFQIGAVYSFNNVLNRPIYSALKEMQYLINYYSIQVIYFIPAVFVVSLTKPSLPENTEST